MATANLYIVADDKKKVNKGLTNVVKNAVSITYKDSTEQINPVIILNKDTENLNNVNYVYLSDKNKYYFVTDSPIELTGKRIAYSLHEDVLMSAKSKFLNLKATIDRAETDSSRIRNGYLIDEQFKAYAYEQITTKKFPNGIQNDSIILITVG